MVSKWWQSTNIHVAVTPGIYVPLRNNEYRHPFQRLNRRRPIVGKGDLIQHFVSRSDFKHATNVGRIRLSIKWTIV